MSVVTEVLSFIANLAIQVISFFGYFGVFILMVFESMILPVPSELVMPFAGFLVAQGKLNLFLTIIASSAGSIVGSLASYYIGRYGGNRFLMRYGSFFLLDSNDLLSTEKWFRKSGEKTVFFSRFIPIIRHVISIPAGVGKMDMRRFLLYTLIGATIWNSLLLMLGFYLGKNWESVRHYSEYISIPVAALIVIGGIFFVFRHIRSRRHKTKLSA